MTKHLKSLARLLLRDYSFYHIYRRNCAEEKPLLTDGLRFKTIEQKEIDSAADRIIADQAWYHGQNTNAYACFKGSRIIGLCFFWHGERYRKRNFWPLADQEAKLVQLFVLPEMRGQGIGKSLIQFATRDMSRREFKYVYARIWRSNTASLRAFKSAGWNRVATVIEIFLWGRNKPFRLELGRNISQERGDKSQSVNR
jgi:ribosomal protein S18 acetylase RimI-like enzyme